MPPELHEDFGEKIGGAKKDLWKDRGLYTDDLDGMNEKSTSKRIMSGRSLTIRPCLTRVSLWAWSFL